MLRKTIHDYASYAPGVIHTLTELSKKMLLYRIEGTTLVISSHI